MRRPVQHVIEDRAEQLTRKILPVEWIFRNMPKDYGIDLEIEMVDADVVTGNRLWVQLKGLTRPPRRVRNFTLSSIGAISADVPGARSDVFSAEYIALSIDTKELKYALRCTVPRLLFVADLERDDVFWLPLQDEVVCMLGDRTPDWRSQKTATVRVPLSNSLRKEAKNNFCGLRWYALEPARLNAFVTLHYYHHEFGNGGRLSGYEIGDGVMEPASVDELTTSLQVASNYLADALSLDVLFGERGIRFFVEIIAQQLRDGLEAANAALVALETSEYDWQTMSSLLGRVDRGINLMSTAIAMYHPLRQKFLLTDGAMA